MLIERVTNGHEKKDYFLDPIKHTGQEKSFEIAKEIIKLGRYKFIQNNT